VSICRPPLRLPQVPGTEPRAPKTPSAGTSQEAKSQQAKLAERRVNRSLDDRRPNIETPIELTAERLVQIRVTALHGKTVGLTITMCQRDSGSSPHRNDRRARRVRRRKAWPLWTFGGAPRVGAYSRRAVGPNVRTRWRAEAEAEPKPNAEAIVVQETRRGFIHCFSIPRAGLLFYHSVRPVQDIRLLRRELARATKQISGSTTGLPRKDDHA